jgi:hypothetical protein
VFCTDESDVKMRYMELEEVVRVLGMAAPVKMRSIGAALDAPA